MRAAARSAGLQPPARGPVLQRHDLLDARRRFVAAADGKSALRVMADVRFVKKPGYT